MTHTVFISHEDHMITYCGLQLFDVYTFIHRFAHITLICPEMRHLNRNKLLNLYSGMG